MLAGFCLFWAFVFFWAFVLLSQEKEEEDEEEIQKKEKEHQGMERSAREANAKLYSKYLCAKRVPKGEGTAAEVWSDRGRTDETSVGFL